MRRTLPPLYRVVVSLRSIGEMPTADTAAYLGITEQGVRLVSYGPASAAEENVRRIRKRCKRTNIIAILLTPDPLAPRSAGSAGI
jgi:hypothetical protein